jgi:cell division protein FtsB
MAIFNLPLAKRRPLATESFRTAQNRGSGLLRAFKNRLRAIIPPVIFLGITWYFAWNAMHGTRGLEAQRVQWAELARAQASFAAIDAQRAIWETRIATLNGQSVTRDMLDCEARLVLNLADPADLVVQLPAGQSANK